jgi:tetratricopeptide (TPR) repeat protein
MEVTPLKLDVHAQAPLEASTTAKIPASTPRAVNGVARASAAASSPAHLPPLDLDLDAQRIAEKAGALVMQARSAQRKQKGREAMALLQQALSLAPTDVHALELLGDLFLEDAEQEKALKAFEYGLKHHPGHRAFEEKIALCILDIEEMKRQRERSQNLLELGASESWMDLAPNRAFGLSALLPGAGHVYAEENERAAWVFGSYVFTTLGWALPLYFGLKGAATNGVNGLNNGISAALGSMNSFVLVWFWLMFAAAIGVYVFGIFDAMAAAERANERRKHSFEYF